MLERILILEDYCDGLNGFAPKIICPMNYHWKNSADADTYIRDAESYLEKAEEAVPRALKAMNKNGWRWSPLI